MFVERGRVRELPLELLPELQNLQMRRGIEDADTANSVADYFAHYRNRPAYVEAGFRALPQHNYQFFDDGPFPNKPLYRDQEEYDAAWQALKALLQPGDCIFTTCRASLVSEIISWATSGPWSHCASYVGEGEIADSVASGLRVAPLEVYRGRQFWIAAYLPYGVSVVAGGAAGAGSGAGAAMGAGLRRLLTFRHGRFVDALAHFVGDLLGALAEFHAHIVQVDDVLASRLVADMIDKEDDHDGEDNPGQGTGQTRNDALPSFGFG